MDNKKKALVQNVEVGNAPVLSIWRTAIRFFFSNYTHYFDYYKLHRHVYNLLLFIIVLMRRSISVPSKMYLVIAAE